MTDAERTQKAMKEIAMAYFTDPAFRKALEDYTWSINNKG